MTTGKAKHENKASLKTIWLGRNDPGEPKVGKLPQLRVNFTHYPHSHKATLCIAMDRSLMACIRNSYHQVWQLRLALGL